MNNSINGQQFRAWFPGVFICSAILVVITSSAGVSAQTKSVDTASVDRLYRLGPEDELEISVWKEEDLNKIVVVRPDGAISFPLVGEIQVSGKSVSQVQTEIRKKIRSYIPEAVVTVSVSKVAGYRIYILGKVKNPGEYVLGSYVDVMQALTLADGLTPYASENDIKIFRHQENGKIVIDFDYSKVTKGRDLNQNITLISGDIVVVP